MSDNGGVRILIELTKPEEIASAERNGALDIIAFQQEGKWYAEHGDYNRWRAMQQRCAVNGPGALP